MKTKKNQHLFTSSWYNRNSKYFFSSHFCIYNISALWLSNYKNTMFEDLVPQAVHYMPQGPNEKISS